MGKVKKTKKFALVKRIIAKNDERIKASQAKVTKKKDEEPKVRQITQQASSLFFKHNEALKPPYQVLVDTNFINFSIQNKLEMVKAMVKNQKFTSDGLLVCKMHSNDNRLRIGRTRKNGGKISNCIAVILYRLIIVLQETRGLNVCLAVIREPTLMTV